MTARLFIHIGPPKTATTSLQYALVEAETEKLSYGGTFQPRSKNQERNSGSLAYKLHKASVEKRTPDHHDVAQTLKGISDTLAAGQSIIISEEGFLVSGKNSAFKPKIDCLSSLLIGIPTTILITLRDPREGLPSLYQELFARLPLDERLSFARFCRGAQARCFDYSHLGDTLKEAGFEDVWMLDFEKLKTGQINIYEVVGGRVDVSGTLCLDHKNVSEKSKDRRVVPAVGFKDFSRWGPLRALIDRTGIRDTGIGRGAIAPLGRIPLRSGKARGYSIPKDVDQRLSEGFEKARRRMREDPGANSKINLAGTTK